MESNPAPESEPMETTDQQPTPTTVVLSPKKKIPRSEMEGLEEEVKPELPPLKNDRGVDQVVTEEGGVVGKLDADVRTGKGVDDAGGEEMRKMKIIVVLDSDTGSIGEADGELGVSPSWGDGRVVVEERNRSGEVEGRKERDGKKDVVVEGREDEEESFPEVNGEKAEVKGPTKSGAGGSGTTYSTEDDGKNITEVETKSALDEDGVRGQKESNESNKTTRQSLPAAEEEIDNAHALDSTMEVDNIPVVSEPQAINRDDHLSTVVAMNQKSLQLSRGNAVQSSDKPMGLESTSEKEDLVMMDEDALLIEVTEASTAPISDTQPTNQQNIGALPVSTEVASSQPRVIPDSDEEDESLSSKTSPVKHQETSSKDTNLSNTPETTNLPLKKLRPPITNLPSSSLPKGTVTPIKPTNTPTKPKTTSSTQSTSQPPSSPAISPPILPKRKLPPPPPTTNDSILRAELKAIKLASLQSRNASLIAEIATKKAQLEEVTKGLKEPAEETVKRHIRLLHEYNDMRDVGQGLLGLVADNRGVRVGELYEEFGVGLKD